MTALPDIPRIYTAISEWAACLVYILLMRKRFKGAKLIAIIAVALILLCVLQYVNGTLALILWIPGMVIAMTFMLFYILACCEIPMLDVGACCAKAFVLAELVASFEWQVYIFFAEQTKWGQWFSIVCMLVLYAAIFPAVYFLERRHMPRGKSLGVTSKEVFSSALIALAIFSMSNISFVYQDTPFSGDSGWGVLYIRTLVDFAGFVMLYAQQEKWQELHMRHELESINNILNQQYEQYQLSRDSIDMLNQKYHDMKHQINIVRAESDPQKKEAYLQEMESGIKMYEAQNKTGNSVLDTILTSKNLYCVRNNINITCVVDGTLLDFMDVMDICTIFGNILDNAIESVEQLSDERLRLIRLAVFAQKEFLMIRIENYCETELKMLDGIPVSTKGNNRYHGYGIKSVQFTVKKYDGTVTIHSENNWFSLRILIPIPTVQM